MSVSISGAVINLDFAAGGSITTTVAIPADCTLAALAVGYGAYSVTPGPTVNSATLGGTPMVLWPSSGAAVSDGTNFGRAIWYALKSPATGGSVSFDVQMSAGTRGRAVIVPLRGDHLTLWQGTANTATNAASANVATLGTVAQPGGLVLDCVGFPDDTPFTVDGTQTQLWNNGDGQGRTGGSSKAGAASVDMLWTIADPRPWAQSVVSVNPDLGVPVDTDFLMTFTVQR